MNEAYTCAHNNVQHTKKNERRGKWERERENPCFHDFHRKICFYLDSKWFWFVSFFSHSLSHFCVCINLVFQNMKFMRFCLMLRIDPIIFIQTREYPLNFVLFSVLFSVIVAVVSFTFTFIEVVKWTVYCFTVCIVLLCWLFHSPHKLRLSRHSSQSWTAVFIMISCKKKFTFLFFLFFSLSDGDWSFWAQPFFSLSQNVLFCCCC